MIPVLFGQRRSLASGCGGSAECRQCFSNSSVPFHCQLLWDSGANENFLDVDIAAQTGIVVESLTAPLDANALDGHVAHCTKPLNLALSTKYQVTIESLFSFTFFLLLKLLWLLVNPG